MRTLVLSAINIFKSGPLTIVRDLLTTLKATPAYQRGDLSIVLFCHKAELYADLAGPNIEFEERPSSRTSWLKRLYFEYVEFGAWSKRRHVDVWMSLHDITPNVQADRRIVYCHNPSPFYRGPANWRYEPVWECVRNFYGWLYWFNLQKNDRIVVQQQWLRDEFVQRYGCDSQKVVVAFPRGASKPDRADAEATTTTAASSITTILYPAFPRHFKNAEAAIEAIRRLSDVPVRLQLTMTGDENAYAGRLKRAAEGLEDRVEFLGFLNQRQVFEKYRESDAMVFPSLLETWGLPLSEYRELGKPIFAADRPYAYESLNGYEQAVFFNPTDPDDLATKLRRFATTRHYEATQPQIKYAEPFAANWSELVDLLELSQARSAGNSKSMKARRAA